MTGASWNLYLDGAPDGTLAVNRVANSATNALTAVGSSLSTTGATSGFFAGVVDEVRIWSVARTAAQIAAAKNTEITGAQAGLLGRWGLNEASGSTATDTAGSSITGNLVATPTRVAGFNAPIQTNQYITLGSAAQLRSATFTVELWFQRTGTGVGTSTGTGGVLTAVPLITKGRAEGETAAADVNYFLGIDQSSGKLVADFEEAQVAQGGTPRASTIRSPAIPRSPSARPGTTPPRPMTARPGTCISTAPPTARSPLVGLPTP